MKAADYYLENGSFNWAAWFTHEAERNTAAIESINKAILAVMKKNLALENEIAELKERNV